MSSFLNPFFEIPVQNPASPLSAHPLFFLIVLDSVKKKGSQRFLLQLEQSAIFLRFLNVHPAVFTSSDERDVKEFCRLNHFPFLIFADPDHHVIGHFSCLQHRAVFGQNKEVFRPCLLLVKHERVICRYRQANGSTLRHVLEKAVRIQFQALEAALVRPIDKKMRGCYDYPYRADKTPPV